MSSASSPPCEDFLAHLVTQELCDAIPIFQVQPIVHVRCFRPKLNLVKFEWSNRLERDLGYLELGALNGEDANMSAVSVQGHPMIVLWQVRLKVKLTFAMLPLEPKR